MSAAITDLVEFAVLGTNSVTLKEAIAKFDSGEYAWQDLLEMSTDLRFGGATSGLTESNIRSTLLAQI